MKSAAGMSLNMSFPLISGHFLDLDSINWNYLADVYIVVFGACFLQDGF